MKPPFGGLIWRFLCNVYNTVNSRFAFLVNPQNPKQATPSSATSRIRCDSWTKAEADARFLRTDGLSPLDARYFVTTPGPEGSGTGIFNLAQTQFVPNIIRNLLCQTPLSCQSILGCKSAAKGQSDGRYPLIATFNSLGQRVTDLENAPGVEPTADLTVNSLTATSFVPLLQSAAADLQIQNATTTIRAEDRRRCCAATRRPAC